MRDRKRVSQPGDGAQVIGRRLSRLPEPYALPLHFDDNPLFGPCLLYTSDAADERSSVDLGGSRIIKQKNTPPHPPTTTPSTS